MTENYMWWSKLIFISLFSLWSIIGIVLFERKTNIQINLFESILYGPIVFISQLMILFFIIIFKFIDKIDDHI